MSTTRPSDRGADPRDDTPDDLDALVPSADLETALPRAGGTAMTRLARWVTGGPGGRGFAVAQAVRRGWWAASDAAVVMAGRLRAAPGPSRPGTVVRRTPVGRVRAEMDPRATPLAVHGRTLAVVAAALEARGVRYFAVPGQPLRVSLAVAERDALGLRAALADAAAAAPLHAGVLRRGRVLSLREVARLPRHAVRKPGVTRVVVPATDPAGAEVLAADDGVDVEVWPARPDGVLVAPRRNRFGPFVDPAALVPDRVAVGDLSLPSFADLVGPHPDDVRFPVDVVYTWVDGDDPAWRERMTAARAAATGHRPAHATAEARFRGFDELRYSLRSVEMYAPWVNHVWLVTDRQVPSWLRTDHPRLTVVDHRDIWVDPELLPVFNSHAIESQLHRIDGLAEHYVYLNDDVFLGRALPPSALFEPGGALRFFPSSSQVGIGPRAADDPATVAAAKNGRQLLRRSVGVSPTQKITHVAHAQRRSVAYELAERFAEDYRRVAGSRFRSADDISPVWLHQWYAHATGRAVAMRLAYQYVDLVSPAAQRRLRILARRRDLDVFCLNQSEDPAVDPGVLRRRLGAFLQAYYPFTSSFELD